MYGLVTDVAVDELTGDRPSDEVHPMTFHKDVAEAAPVRNNSVNGLPAETVNNLVVTE